MNAQDITRYGHLWVLRHIDSLTDDEWQTAGVCGWWSVKEIIAHLTSFEWMLADLLMTFIDAGPTPTLDQYKSMDGDAFNNVQVKQREGKSPAEILAEYNEANKKVTHALGLIPVETLRQAGTIPWYGLEYALDDLIVYAFYGHKREHCAQIAVYRDRLKEEKPAIDS